MKSNGTEVWRKLIGMQKKSNKSTVFIMLFMVGLFLFMGGMEFFQIRKWDRKIATYDHVKGVLLSHDRVRRGSGRSIRTVSEIKYRFNYKNHQYSGDDIVYGEDDFPQYQKGKIINIIVNPQDPSDSAAMVYYGSPLIKYGMAIFCAVIAAVMIVIILFKLLKPEAAAPQKFIDYVDSFPPEKIEQLRHKDIRVVDAPKFELAGSIKYKYQHFAVITNSIGKIAETIFFILILMNVVGTIVTSQLIILLPTAFLLFIAFITRPKKIIFDLIEKRFHSERSCSFSRNMVYHDFKDVEFLAIVPMLKSKGGLYFTLFAVKNDNSAVFITQLPSGQFNRLCSTTLKVASLLDNPPVVVKIE